MCGNHRKKPSPKKGSMFGKFRKGKKISVSEMMKGLRDKEDRF